MNSIRIYPSLSSISRHLLPFLLVFTFLAILFFSNSNKIQNTFIFTLTGVAISIWSINEIYWLIKHVFLKGEIILIDSLGITHHRKFFAWNEVSEIDYFEDHKIVLIRAPFKTNIKIKVLKKFIKKERRMFVVGSDIRQPIHQVLNVIGNYKKFKTFPKTPSKLAFELARRK